MVVIPTFAFDLFSELGIMGHFVVAEMPEWAILSFNYGLSFRQSTLRIDLLLATSENSHFGIT